ncbi:unnamed protein product [Rangifer tarandus platyrhynchus]|uniref:Uncharacterized protein n=1 Tax=Rangifer tarandus platyrhynchus TaxID=3082113 RepID=A0AC59Z8K5_RANTA
MLPSGCVLGERKFETCLSVGHSVFQKGLNLERELGAYCVLGRLMPYETGTVGRTPRGEAPRWLPPSSASSVLGTGD